ncbi:organic anion transmembrane transporter activity protein [Homalodisca vitripennis]|nr:organic anion transmembrane transporter activity protein [Homalodisca vitripennis]
MSNVDFDDVLVQIGERGRYQNIMYYLLCVPATLPAVFLAFSQVFVSASPDHWCRLPSLEHTMLGIKISFQVSTYKMLKILKLMRVLSQHILWQHTELTINQRDGYSSPGVRFHRQSPSPRPALNLRCAVLTFHFGSGDVCPTALR